MTQKELPKSVRVGPFDYEVVQSEGLLQEHDHFGKALAGSLRLLLDSSLHLQRQQETLIHEVIHAILFTYKSALEGTDEERERYAKLLASALLQVIQDSPAFWLFLAPGAIDATVPHPPNGLLAHPEPSRLRGRTESER